MTEATLDGRYRLVRLLGRGGMGEVWQARDARIGRDVAVKIMTAAGLTAEASARFDREARIIGNLSGPSIVTVHDYGHDEYAGETVPYLVMELVAGRTIADRVRTQGPAAPRTALEWTRQVCEALSVAHQANVVHRDIKPSNVMVTDAGAVKVLDFGIARFVGHEHTDTGLTATGMVIGSVEYMSPEQAQGRELDARSDLYSLGCLLYFALTGRGPFEADTPMGLAVQHVSKTPEAPSLYRPGIPPAVDSLVLALMAKDPQDRPGDAWAVAERIKGLLAQRPDPTTVELPQEAAGDTKPLLNTGTTPTHVGSTNADGGLWTPAQGDTSAILADSGSGTGYSSGNGNGNGNGSGYSSGSNTELLKENRSRRWFLSGAAVVAVGGAAVGTWLAVDSGSKSPGTGSDSAGHGLGTSSGSGSPSVTPHAVGASSSASAPTSASASTSPPPPTDPVPIAKLTDQKSAVNHITFSPDSKILITAAQDNTARLYDVSNPALPKTIGVCAKHTAMVFDVAVSPDGHTLATSSHDKTLGLWDISVPDAPRLLAQLHLGDQLTGVAFSPDGTLVAVGTYGGDVLLIDVRQPTGALKQRTLSGHSTLAYSVAFSPDGKTLATSSFDKTVKLWDVRTPSAALLLGTATGHTDRVFDIAYHPGGKLLATGSGDHKLILFDVSNPAAPSVTATVPEDDEATGVAFSPDGRLVANGGGASAKVRLYDITAPASPRELAPLSGQTAYALGVAFSPDGKLLACADQDTTVLMWRF
ncbi:serine/threonine protein kinase with WD40 repeats [Catenulispora acidiphila DSM 44928]|uniref:non-specific serine/threonine protein kinase n=1 Tax=Catenulispora acidiphila (strain DSM 44928 / JCM 14897 / NBRC 102108 / NRRL B-24433 / ID139908) TaxID=479433 RepID=C7Q0R1_CATAD|nr:serine/threonine-protein kinase [Catenulispora acidiphila]ACU69689.1 serine/threonine protein kinase with WD40 repeats [Catenulispora acidiphila DSM 44928]